MRRRLGGGTCAPTSTDEHARRLAATLGVVVVFDERIQEGHQVSDVRIGERTHFPAL
jgi:hypothetical protein